jgi:hypothetical protein
MRNCSENKSKLIFVLFFIGFALRFYFAYFYPITLDEALSYYISKLSIKEIYHILRIDDISPAFIYILHKFFDFAKTEFGVRWIFFVFNFSTLFFIYKFSENSISALIISVFSFFIIKDGDIARMHSLSLFLSSISVYFFFKYLKENNKKALFLFGLSSVMMSYNFYPSMALAPSMLFSLLFFPQYRKEAFKYISILVLIFLFSMPSFIFLNFNSLKSNYISLSFPKGAFLPYILYSFSISESIMDFKNIKSINILYFLVLLTPFLFVFLRGIYYGIKELKVKIILSSLVISFFVVFSLSIFIPKLLYSPKYLIWLYPFFIYLLVKGTENLNKGYKVSFYFIFISLNLLAYSKAFVSNREDWRNVAEFINKESKPCDRIYIFKEQMKYPFSFYYEKNFYALSNKETDFELSLEKGCSVWYIKSHDFSPSGFYERKLSEKLKLSSYYKKGDIEIYKYEEN